MAFRWKPRILLRVACASQAVLTLICTFIALSRQMSVVATLFGASTLFFLLASAGMQRRTFTALGAAALITALVRIVWVDGAGLDYAIFLGAPALCIAGMSYAMPVHTKQRTGSTPSSETAS